MINCNKRERLFLCMEDIKCQYFVGHYYYTFVSLEKNPCLQSPCFSNIKKTVLLKISCQRSEMYLTSNYFNYWIVFSFNPRIMPKKVIRSIKYQVQLITEPGNFSIKDVHGLNLVHNYPEVAA